MGFSQSTCLPALRGACGELGMARVVGVPMTTTSTSDSSSFLEVVHSPRPGLFRPGARRLRVEVEGDRQIAVRMPLPRP